MKKLLTLFFVVSIFACSVQKQNERIFGSWMGLYKPELIKTWGPPTRYESDGGSGEILVYEKKTTSGYAYGNSVTVRDNVKYAMFYADSTGKLYHWRCNY